VQRLYFYIYFLLINLIGKYLKLIIICKSKVRKPYIESFILKIKKVLSFIIYKYILLFIKVLAIFISL